MKKILSIFLILTLIFVISACGGEGGESTTGDGNGEQEIEPIVYSEGLAFTSNGDGTCFVSGIGNCEDIKLVIPLTSPEGDKVVGIGKDAFAFSDQVRFVILHSGIEYIEGGAFSYCGELRYVVIYEGLARIGDFAFHGNSNLESIYFTGNEPAWLSISISAENESLINAKINIGYFPG